MGSKKCLKCNREYRIQDMRYSKILKRYICNSCDNEIKIQTYIVNNEIMKNFNLDNELEIYLTFDKKTKKFKEIDIEISQYEETFCKTLNREISIKLFNFLKENLGELLK